MPTIKYRLSLNLSNTSIGYALIGLDGENNATKIIRTGTRIFDEGRVPKTKDSLAQSRRQARSMRRCRDRKIQRKDALLKRLKDFNFVKDDEVFLQKLKKLDPLQLRVFAINGKCEKHEIARALLNLNYRRGFNATRIDDDDESGKIATVIKRMAEDMAITKSRTVAEYLIKRRAKNQPTKFEVVNGQGEIFASREMIKKEFELIRDTQKEHHPEITQGMWDEIERTIFFQRPLKEVTLGQCIIFQDELRTYEGMPSFQRFQILENLSHLHMKKDGQFCKIDTDTKRKLYYLLMRSEILTRKELHSFLGLKKKEKTTLKHPKGLVGDKTAVLLSSTDYFGEGWFSFPLDKQDDIVFTLITKDKDVIFQRATTDWNLSNELATKLSQIPLKKLNTSSQPFSLKALRLMSDEMLKDFITHTKARQILGFPEIEYTGQYPKLAYYGEVLPHAISNFAKVEKPLELKTEEERYGKVNNPTFHIVLNQVRKLVNSLMEDYGKPQQIILELTKDLKHSYEVENERKKLADKNLKANKEINEILIADFGISEPKYRHRLRYKLWVELNDKKPELRFCPYSGVRIDKAELFSDKFIIDHIIPLSKSYDDSIGNKTLCSVTISTKKIGKSPFEAFGAGDAAKAYQVILDRVKEMPEDKRMLFSANAMDKIKEKVKQHFSDMAFIAKTFENYLQTICVDTWVVHSRLSSLLMKNWSLQEIIEEKLFEKRKFNEDLRRHALNAAMIGTVDSELSLLSKYAVVKKSAKGELIDIQVPWGSFKEDLAEKLGKVVVSCKVDHSTAGRFLKDLVYGKIDPLKYDGHNLAIRKSLFDANKETILDKRIRDEVLALPKHKSPLDNKEELKKYSEAKGIKRVKTLVKASNPIEIRHTDRGGVVHAKQILSAENHNVAIWRMMKGVTLRDHEKFDVYDLKDFSDKYVISSQNLYEAAKGVDDRPHPGAKLVMRLHKGDTILYRKKTGESILGRVIKLDPCGTRIFIQPHYDEMTEVGVGFKSMIETCIEKVFVDTIGNLRRGDNVIERSRVRK